MTARKNLVAITGATGFVGQALLDEAARQGIEVRALTRREQPARKGVEWVRGDLADTRALRKLAKGAEALIHVAGVVNAPTLKPFDSETVVAASRGAGGVVSVENHSVIGGLGSAVAESLAEAGVGVPLRRIGLRDTFAEGSRTGPYLFQKYGLSTAAIVNAAWQLARRPDPAPAVEAPAAEAGEYAPV